VPRVPPFSLPLLRAGLAALAAGGPALVTAVRSAHRSTGAGTRRFDYSASPQFSGGLFHNRLPPTRAPQGGRAALVKELAAKGRRGKPLRPVAVVRPRLPDTAGTLAATWLGHATVLLELDGHRVLTDPVWSERVSPSAGVGPRRMHPVPLPLEQLPRLDAVLISHDHYDHLDTATIDALVATQQAPFVVPLGVGRHLQCWGVPADRIVELDWDQSHQVAGLRLTCTEARHFSGRSVGSNTTLWSSWVISGEVHRAYFGGDSGYTPAYAEIGRRHGPFDLTVLPIGAYDRLWPDVHMHPGEAVQAHGELRGRLLLPIHWATFDLAFHGWADPVEWLLTSATEAGTRLALPAPGERFVPSSPPTRPWWRDSV
jgi:L-ascorbate metabolism protein UlaG (beta-lactamase superfamily)